MVPSIQWYEVVWMGAVVYTIIAHSRLRRRFTEEKDYQIAQGQNGILGYIADTGIYVQTHLRRVQYPFAVLGIYSLLRTPRASPTWHTWFFVALIISAEFGLVRVATLIAQRHDGELKLARSLIDKGMLNLTAQFGTEQKDSMRNLMDRVEKMLDRLEAGAVVVAQDLRDRYQRADAVHPESSPGAAADAASQSGE
jgi:hypothetical protein